VCRQFRLPEGYDALSGLSFDEFCDGVANSKVNMRMAPFLACGDLNGYDSDRNYALDAAFVPAVQPPIHPPYESSVNAKRGK